MRRQSKADMMSCAAGFDLTAKRNCGDSWRVMVLEIQRQAPSMARIQKAITSLF
jgi:hypothetical protein